jgi:hypothetical protein
MDVERVVSHLTDLLRRRGLVLPRGGWVSVVYDPPMTKKTGLLPQEVVVSCLMKEIPKTAPFQGYLRISISGDMRAVFTNPEGVVYETSLFGCTCPGYVHNEHCKHWEWLWSQTPCSCGQLAWYHSSDDAYHCGLCGRIQEGEAVRQWRVAQRQKQAG